MAKKTISAVHRKGQVHTLETVSVLLAFFVILALGAAFYVKVLKGGFEAQKEEASQLKSVAVAQKAVFLPELQCSENNIVSDNCFDMLKLDAAAELIRQNEKYYYDALEFSNITLSSIYPEARSWVIYSKPLDSYSSKSLTHVPISIFDAKNKKYKFGVLAIETYHR